MSSSEFLNKKIKFKITNKLGVSSEVEQPIGNVLPDLDKIGFGDTTCIGVMQKYVELMNQGNADLSRFTRFVSNFCVLINHYVRYRNNLYQYEFRFPLITGHDRDGFMSTKYGRNFEEVLKSKQTLPEQDQQQQTKEMLLQTLRRGGSDHDRIHNAFYYTIVDAIHDNTKMFYAEILDKAATYVEHHNASDLLNLCSHLLEQGIPILTALHQIQEKNGQEFIEHLNLKSLLSSDEYYVWKQFKGGRRTRRHKRSGHKRSGHKRSDKKKHCGKKRMSRRR